MGVERRRRRPAPSPTPESLAAAAAASATFRPGDQHVDRRAELRSRGERARRQIAQTAVRDFGQKKRRHGQITPASSCSLATSSATVLTFTPALRPLGSAVFSTFRRGVTSTPKSAGVFSSIGFFFAFMMLGSEA